MAKVSLELNRSIKFGFVFKDSSSMIYLKPMVDGIQEIKNNNNNNNTNNISSISRSFTKMDINLTKKRSGLSIPPVFASEYLKYPGGLKQKNSM